VAFGWGQEHKQSVKGPISETVQEQDRTKITITIIILKFVHNVHTQTDRQTD